MCHKTEGFLENQQYRLVSSLVVSVWHIYTGAENKKRSNIHTMQACLIKQTKQMMTYNIQDVCFRLYTNLQCPILCLESINVTHWHFWFSLFISLKNISECQNLLHSWILKSNTTFKCLTSNILLQTTLEKLKNSFYVTHWRFH